MEWKIRVLKLFDDCLYQPCYSNISTKVLQYDWKKLNVGRELFPQCLIALFEYLQQNWYILWLFDHTCVWNVILKKKFDKFNKEYFDNQDATALTCTGKLDKFITLKILKFNFLCRKPLTLGGKKIFFFNFETWITWYTWVPV